MNRCLLILIILFPLYTQLPAQSTKTEPGDSTGVNKSNDNHTGQPLGEITHWRHMFYTNLLESYLSMTPNLRYEYYLNERTSITACLKLQIPNILLDIFSFGGTWSIGQEYFGPGTECGWRRYSPTRRYYYELNSGAAYLKIRNTLISTSSHGDFVGSNQLIYSSDRYDVGFNIVAGMLTGKRIRSYPPRKFFLRSLFLSAGLRYSWVSTSIGPVYYNNGKYQDLTTNCVARNPALMFSRDMVPNGSYLLPTVQLGAIFGVAY